MHIDYTMIQTKLITAPKVDAKTPQGVIGMPFTGGAFYVTL